MTRQESELDIMGQCNVVITSVHRPYPELKGLGFHKEDVIQTIPDLQATLVKPSPLHPWVTNHCQAYDTLQTDQSC